MTKKRHIVLCFLVFCLTATLLVGVTSSAPYDPWVDGNDDGIIDIVDIVNLAIRFGEEGTPINKTELLLDLLERVPRAGNISVPAAAFAQAYDGFDWRNYGYQLRNYDSALNSFWYAQVQLPHGANVTNFTSYFYDNNASYSVICYLERYNSGATWIMASATAPVTYNSGHGSYQDPTIQYPTVDNNNYAYFLQVSVPSPSTDFHFKYAVIEYEYPA